MNYKIGKLKTFVGTDPNLRNLKCKIECIMDDKLEVIFDDSILGRFRVTVNKKDII